MPMPGDRDEADRPPRAELADSVEQVECAAPESTQLPDEKRRVASAGYPNGQPYRYACLSGWAPRNPNQ
jgi:hypothetical protein